MTLFEMAKEACFTTEEFALYELILERLEALVRADEREACADLCYQLVNNSRETRFAAAIRARGNT